MQHDQGVSPLSDDVQRYWEERAESHEGSASATTNDIHLRRLEVATIAKSIGALDLAPGSRVVDIGCGDGRSTLQLAAAFPHLEFLGIDYSESMVEAAVSAVATNPLSNASFAVEDIRRLGSAYYEEAFDVALTDRCLINLGSLDEQTRAIETIADLVAPNGTYIAVENFIDGHENMNRGRQDLGLEPIPIRWHNVFFTEENFVRATTPHFELVSFSDFSSSYYFATRLVYAAMCQRLGESPDYDHPIHQLAPDLPPTGCFSPIRKVELRRRSMSASGSRAAPLP